MFERYTEKARRVIFFARWEASQFGSPYIETEHLLLGVMREDKVLTNRFLRSHASGEAIRRQIEAHTPRREKVSTSVDLPLSDEGKRVLAYAAEEAERLSHQHIGTEHLLLGLLREEKSLAAQILHERGLRLAAVRVELHRAPQEKSYEEKTRLQTRDRESSLLGWFTRDLSEAAMNGLLEPLAGRDDTVEALLEVLCSRDNRNPLLICAPGVSGRSIAESLAQVIADGQVPAFLGEKRLLALDLEQMLEADNKSSIERLTAVVKELTQKQDCIVFIDEIHRLADLDFWGKFRRALLNGEIQCIGATTTADYEGTVRNVPWMGRCFRNIHVGPMLEEDVVQSLHAHKNKLEKFHGVVYEEEAIACAVRYSARYFPDESSFEKAMEMLDVAGARVKLRMVKLPEELIQMQKRIKFIAHRMENAIANHEFDKARFYSDEERKQREELEALRDKHHLGEPSKGIVQSGDIVDVVSRWIGYPVDSIKEDRRAIEE